MHVQKTVLDSNHTEEPQIRLTLQFHVDGLMTSIDKQVVIDLNSAGLAELEVTNPLRTINRVTAAILRVVDGANSAGTAGIGPQAAQATSQSGRAWTRFTRREFEVAQFVLSGATNQDIATVLGISQNTVKFHVKNILEKSNVKNRYELSRALVRLRPGGEVSE